MAEAGSKSDEVERSLARLVRGVRARQRAGRVASALVALFVSSAVARLAATALGAPVLPAVATGVALALLPIAFRARGSRPSDTALVAFIDHRLRAGAAVTTFHELGAATALPASVVDAASASLAHADLRSLAPWRPNPNAIVALCFGIASWGVSVALPPEPTSRPHPHEEARVRLVDPPELRALAQLRTVPIADARAVERALRESEELRRRLASGTTRADALERVARMRDELSAAAASETDTERHAREEAAASLAHEPEMAAALAARDLDRLSRAVERAAARREASDRATAREALEDAATAARAAGDERLARSLERRRDLLQARAEQVELARRLAASMPELAGRRLERSLEAMARDGNGAELDRAMVDAMAEAWTRLTAEERQKLADAMQRASMANASGTSQSGGADGGAGRPMSADDVEAALRAALANLDHMSMQLGGAGGMPIAGMGSGGGSTAGSGLGTGSGGGPSGGTGGSSGGGPGGTPTGRTGPVTGDPLLARVTPLTSPAGRPSSSWIERIDPGTGGRLAPVAGGSTGAAATDPTNAIDRSPLPEDVREQVRTYFGGSQ